MRICILVALLPCALLAQTSPPQTAGPEAFQKLPQRLDWLQPGAQQFQGDLAARLFPAPARHRGGAMAMLPKVCSIPLLRAPIPKGKMDRMAVTAPPAESIDPQFVVPAPPVCEDWNR
ncbi:MAG: hypothetical protein ACLQKA_12110 [Bryobacteraceae bacterium]